jgi:pilus assembly protein CpaB
MLRKKQILMTSAEGELKHKLKIAAIGVSLSAVGFSYVMLNSGNAPPPPSPPPVVQSAPLDRDEVLVAAHDIPMGMRIADASVDWQPWPKASISDQMIVKSSSPDILGNINGFMSRVSFVKGEPMRLDKLVKGGEGGFMSAILPAGMRAVAMKIDNGGDSEAGGFILPNDRVDVVRVYRDDMATIARGSVVSSSQTILANVRVLAVGQNVEEENGKKVVTGSNATLELDPSQAELVVLAENTNGSELHLVLRSLMDSGGAAETVSDLSNENSGGLTILRFGVARQAAR